MVEKVQSEGRWEGARKSEKEGRGKRGRGEGKGEGGRAPGGNNSVGSCT
jgi:hypothetical protein